MQAVTLAQDLKAVLEIADTLRARQSSRDDRLAEKLDELVARIESQVARLERIEEAARDLLSLAPQPPAFMTNTKAYVVALDVARQALAAEEGGDRDGPR